jgi:hypothetical protein
MVAEIAAKKIGVKHNHIVLCILCIYIYVYIFGYVINLNRSTWSKLNSTTFKYISCLPRACCVPNPVFSLRYICRYMRQCITVGVELTNSSWLQVFLRKKKSSSSISSLYSSVKIEDPILQTYRTANKCLISYD